jgi:hypothetical protein
MRRRIAVTSGIEEDRFLRPPFARIIPAPIVIPSKAHGFA